MSICTMQAHPNQFIQTSRAGRVGVLAYGLVCYAVFLATFLYAIGFVVGVLTPTRLDDPAAAPLGKALVINLGLLTLFALQHSIMARPAFKRRLHRVVPPSAERSTYVLASSLALIALFAFWQPMGLMIWNVQPSTPRVALYMLGGLGWLLVLASTFLINHFDLFGLRQAWLCFRGIPYRPLIMKTPGPYRLVRHPLYVGWLIAFWATPTMTLAHFVFALITTVYILVAIQFEERDLIAEHGESYRAYRRRVPMLVPRLWRRRNN
ncbi:MAG: isoprenylcysteine carboxylmethyltransferase family protein [Phycisphaeraceae bacterium]|nr:isoprenylcysteine carboxylmethyltransferase family protein [Phycisphaeraceae bacterium]